MTRPGTKQTDARHVAALAEVCGHEGCAVSNEEWVDRVDPYGAIDDSVWKTYVHRLVHAGSVEASGHAEYRLYRPAGTHWPFVPPSPETTPRECLGCGAGFDSTHKGHRVCDGCKKSATWQSGVAQPCVLPQQPARHRGAP